MLDYRARVVDAELSEQLTSIGAVLIDGQKGCGKTEIALQQAKSSVRFDTGPNARALLGLNLDELFDQKTPILSDEWQRVPEIWDQVRRHIDDLRRRGLYVLTGSATPRYERELHSHRSGDPSGQRSKSLRWAQTSSGRITGLRAKEAELLT